MTRRKTATVSAALALTLAVGGGSAAVASSAHHHKHHGKRVTHHGYTLSQAQAAAGDPAGPQVQDVPAAQSQAFGILRRDVQSSDRLSAADQMSWTPMNQDDQRGSNPSLARKANAEIDGRHVIVGPGLGGVCWSVEGDGGPSCGDPKYASSTGLITTTGSADGVGGIITAGLVPDGVDVVTLSLENGSEQKTSVSDNAFVFRSTTPPASVFWTGSSGAVHKQHVPH